VNTNKVNTTESVENGRPSSKTGMIADLNVYRSNDKIPQKLQNEKEERTPQFELRRVSEIERRKTAERKKKESRRSLENEGSDKKIMYIKALTRPSNKNFNQGMHYIFNF
jgi:membrane protein involved in colicin uptake